MCGKDNVKLGELLDAVSYICYNMLRYGAEISRVEDTARRICKAYDVEEANIFALSSTIIITVKKNDETLTQTRRLNAISTNLHRVKQLNSLSREICSGMPDYESIMDSIDKIENGYVYPVYVSVIAYALISGAFAVFYGGAAADCIAAACIGTAVRCIMLILERFYAAPVIITAAASAAAAVGARITAFFYGGLNVNIVIIGILMNLVPGVALVNSIRDFAATDYVSGSSRLVEAFFTAAAIAVGVAVSLIWQ